MYFRLAQKYCEQVANPMEMVLFRKESGTSKKSKSNLSTINDELEDMALIFEYNVNNFIILLFSKSNAINSFY